MHCLIIPIRKNIGKAVKTLRWICQTNHLEYIYITFNFDENKVTYVMTVANDDSEKRCFKCESAGAEVDHSLWDAEKRRGKS